MEKVYPPESFGATDPLNLDTYFKEYQAALSLSQLPSTASIDTPKNIATILQKQFKLPFSYDDILDLESLCTIEKLTSRHENRNLPLKNIQTSRNNHSIPEIHEIVYAKDLATVRSQEELNISSHEDPVKMYEKRLNTTNINDPAKKADPAAIKDIEPGSVFIQRVSFLMPLDFLQGKTKNADYLKVQYEIEILSTNTLLDLANSLKCISDMLPIKAVDNMNKNNRDLANPKIEYPSRCFFIENTFYNDMSAPNSIDYSEVIQKWAMEKNIGMFGTKSMNVTIGSLKPRFGYGYVFIHQGNCEHVVCFSDARLAQNNDDLASNNYPKVLTARKTHNSSCLICTSVHASWLVVGSDRLIARRAFLCTECCKSYMFSDGKKIGEFLLYPISNTSIDSRVKMIL